MSRRPQPDALSRLQPTTTPELIEPAPNEARVVSPARRPIKVKGAAAFKPPQRPRPATPQTSSDKRRQRRIDLNFTNAFAVMISNPLLGESSCIARNISEGGMFVECNDPFPLGSSVKVRFRLPANLTGADDDTLAMGRAEGRERAFVPPIEIVARAEIKNHYFINYADHGLGPRSVAGMGVRFVGFEDDGDERLRSTLSKMHLH